MSGSDENRLKVYVNVSRRSHPIVNDDEYEGDSTTYLYHTKEVDFTDRPIDPVEDF